MEYSGEQLLAMLEQDDELTVRSLAEELGLTTGQVSGRVFRAKQRREEGKQPRGNEKTEDIIEGNNRQVKSLVIQTLDDLIKFCNVDLEEWSIRKHVVNFWGNSANPNTQVKAWLTKTQPEAIHPVISPVEIDIGKAAKPPARKLMDGRVLVIGDPHVGFDRDIYTGRLTNFHDRRALDTALQVAEAHQPDAIVFLGDILDLAEWSDKFLRSPEAYHTTQPAIIEAAWWLGRFRQVCPDSRIVLLEGNHEHRIPKLLIKHFQVAYELKPADALDGPPLISMPKFLGLDDIGVEWIDGYPEGEYWITENFCAEHGETVRKKSGHSVAAELDDLQYSVVFGHIHRIEMATKSLRNRNGSWPITAFSPGCTCHIDGRVPGAKKDNNWQQGIGMIEIYDGRDVPVSIPINDGRAFYEGQIFEARDRLEDLRQDTGWEF